MRPIVISGMSVKPFRGLHSLQELQCTGTTLSADSDLVYMVLFKQSSKDVLAFVNPRKGECSTSEEYVSCAVDDADTRKSTLRALISDVNEGESRAYGCNVTAIVSGGLLKTISWSLTVRHPREYCRISW